MAVSTWNLNATQSRPRSNVRQGVVQQLLLPAEGRSHVMYSDTRKKCQLAHREGRTRSLQIA